MKFFRIITATAVILLTIGFIALQNTYAAGIDDKTHYKYLNLFKGKKVVFLPVAMGFDLTAGWGAVIKKEAESLGMKYEVRDPNWSTAAGAQALTSLISEKPDVIVVHNPDVNSYSKLLRKAERAGIYIIQINMKSTYSTSAYVGADYINVGETAAEQVAKLCGPGTSGKVAVVQGVITAAASAYNMKGIENVFNKHPNIKVISNQGADWDATKAHDITATVLRQHPDLCAVIGFWDVMDTGTGAAIREFQKQVKRDTPVHLVTSGGGSQFSCDAVKKGMFHTVISFDVPGQGRDVNSMIHALVQSKQKPGTNKFVLFSPLKIITKETVRPGSCWEHDSLK